MLSEGELHVQAMRLVCEALADREKTGLEVDWDVIQQMLDHMDTILQGITDQRNDDAEQIQILTKARDAAYGQVSTVRDEVAAEIETLRRTNIGYLQTQLDDARAVNVDLQGQLDVSRGETAEVRRRNFELVKERDAALATVDLQRAGIELLNTCLSKIRQHVADMHEQEDLMEVLVDIRSALEELDAGTAPAPETEPAHCPECERWQRAKRIDSELVASKAKEIERLRAFVDKVRSVIDNDCDGLEIEEMIEALAELDGTNSEATLNSSVVEDSLTTEPEGEK